VLEGPESVIVSARMSNAELLYSNARVIAAHLRNEPVNVSLHVQPPNGMRLSCGAELE